MAAPLDATQAPINPTSEPPLGDTALSPASIKLTPEQVVAAGLDGLATGDSFTVTITGTVKSSDDGVTADITEASMGEKAQPEAEEAGIGEFQRPTGKIEMGPGPEMNF